MVEKKLKRKKCNNLRPKEDKNSAQALGGDVGNHNLFEIVRIKSINKEFGYVMVEQELELTLLRHWTLYDNLWNSNYLV